MTSSLFDDDREASRQFRWRAAVTGLCCHSLPSVALRIAACHFPLPSHAHVHLRVVTSARITASQVGLDLEVLSVGRR